MPRPVRRNRRFRVEWPAWRWSPDGEKALFERPEDVPEGWTAKPPVLFNQPEVKPRPTREEVLKNLKELGVTPDPRWGLGKLIEVWKELAGGN